MHVMEHEHFAKDSLKLHN